MYGIPLDIAEVIRQAYGKSRYRGEYKDIEQSWTYRGNTVTYTLSTEDGRRDRPYDRLTIDVTTTRDRYRFLEVRGIRDLTLAMFFQYDDADCPRRRPDCGRSGIPMTVGTMSVSYDGGRIDINILG